MNERDVRDPRIEAAHAFARSHDTDPEHACQVCRTSLALFDALGDLHGLSDRERVLLHAAALMHDTGYENRPDQHHKGSRDLILASKLDGFSIRELMMVACIARYHRRGDPDPSHKVYRDLDDDGRDTVGKLAAILRVADGLDRSHTASAAAIRVEQDGDVVRLFVKQPDVNPGDIAAAEHKAGLFERVFGVMIEIVPE